MYNIFPSVYSSRPNLGSTWPGAWVERVYTRQSKLRFKKKKKKKKPTTSGFRPADQNNVMHFASRFKSIVEK
jgi:hypothetical protein